MNYYDRISYDCQTGIFTWVKPGRGITVGLQAGTVSRYGYRLIKIGFKSVRAGRLAWFMVHGEWPKHEIDHINGNSLDDRIENLRDIDRAANSQNRRRAHRDNLSCGLLGATWNKQHKRWQAKIVANKTRHHLGYFEDPQDAHVAYMAAKQRLHISGGKN